MQNVGPHYPAAILCTHQQRCQAEWCCMIRARLPNSVNFIIMPTQPIVSAITTLVSIWSDREHLAIHHHRTVNVSVLSCIKPPGNASTSYSLRPSYSFKESELTKRKTCNTYTNCVPATIRLGDIADVRKNHGMFAGWLCQGDDKARRREVTSWLTTSYGSLTVDA